VPSISAGPLASSPRASSSAQTRTRRLHDVVMFGNMSIPIEAAVKHGMLDKNGTTYTTLQPAQAATRVNS
jgi:hypothetical protein